MARQSRADTLAAGRLLDAFATLASGENPDATAFTLPVSGSTFRSEGTVTRPANTTAYTANDIVTNSVTASTAIDFPLVAREAGGGATLLSARLSTNNPAIAATRFRLWLFRDTPASIPVDNAAYAITFANSQIRLGYYDFLTGLAGSDCVDWWGVWVSEGGMPVVPVGTSLKGLLQVLDGFTPLSAQSWRAILHGYQD